MSLRAENEQLRATVEQLQGTVEQLYAMLEVGEHHIRAKILVWLRGRRQGGSPIAFAKHLDDPDWSVGAIAYHFRTLARRGDIRFSRSRPVRGTTEHFYVINGRKKKRTTTKAWGTTR